MVLPGGSALSLCVRGLEEYGTPAIRESFRTFKDCSPYCTVTCVRQVSMFDAWRGE
jgi:hypothetical protein